MLFKNAYELVHYLFSQGMLQGFYIGLRGEFSIESSLKNPKLLMIIDSIFDGLNKKNLSDYWDLNQGGFYLIDENEEGELILNVTILDNLLDSYGHPFDIEVFLRIVCEELGLKTPDYDDWLEYQICIDLNLEYIDLNQEIYEFSILNVKSIEKGKIEQELKKKLNEDSLTNVKAKLALYFAEKHRQEHTYYYPGFNLKIVENYFNEYDGSGFESYQGLKLVLEQNEINLNVSTKDIF